jgi:hypothetical protein
MAAATADLAAAYLCRLYGIGKTNAELLPIVLSVVVYQ